jgi:enterochelin esterase-like enzyme
MPDRRRALALGAAVLALGPGVIAQPASQLIESRLESRAGPVSFQLYLPAGYLATGERRYPVLLLLHGRGDDLSAWARMRPLLDEMIVRGEIPPLIAVMPDAPWSRRGSYYVDSAHEQGSPVQTLLLDELLPHIDAGWRTRTERDARLVGGYSMGGYGALRFALARPEAFGAALVLSPAVYTPLPPPGSSAREFGAFGRGPTLFVDEIYQRLNYPTLLRRLRDLAPALRVFIAAGDQEYKQPADAEATHDIDMEAHLLFSRLSRQPGCRTALRILGGGHDWSVWQPAFHEGLRWAARELDWQVA